MVDLQKEQTDRMNEDLELMVRERQRERERPEMPEGSPRTMAEISPPEQTLSITEGAASSSSQPQPKAKAKMRPRVQSLQPEKNTRTNYEREG